MLVGVAAVVSAVYAVAVALKLTGRLRFSLADWITDRTTAQQRREINAWVLVAWLTAGLAIWVVLRNALIFVGFMSLYANWATHWGALGSETPVEVEGDHVDVERADNVDVRGDDQFGL